MKKMVMIIVILVLLVGSGFLVYQFLERENKATIQTKLSNRAREFLTSQSASESSELKNVNLAKKRFGEDEFDEQRITVPGCYSLIVPFKIETDRRNEPCVYYALLSSPRGSFTTSLREVGFTKVSEAPDVTFRRNKKDEYQEVKLQVNGQEVLHFTNTKTPGEQTAFMMVEGKMFTVSGMISTTPDSIKRQIVKVLESFELEEN